MTTVDATDVVGRVFDVQRFCVHDGPGIRTTVFLAGCSLRCAWCHNPESFTGASARELTPAAVMSEVLEDRDYYATSGGGLTLSGGEPLLQPEFARALLALAQREGVHTSVQTAGDVPSSAFLEVIDHVDLFQFDLKHLDANRHRELTGAGNERLLANAALLVSRGANVEFRMPVVPGLNDDAVNVASVARFLVAHGVSTLRLVPYQRTYLDKYKRLGLTARCAANAPASPRDLDAVAARLNDLGVGTVIDA